MSRATLPNLFVVGAAKSGTTSLHYYLGQHPSIFMAMPKEPHFFSQIEPSPELAPMFPHIASESDYLALFKHAEGAQWRGEASTSYLWSESVPERISKLRTNPRFLAILRDPVERAYSHYLNDVREGFQRKSFEESIDEEIERSEPPRWGADPLYLQIGYYGHQIERYFDAFGRERVLVLVFEEFFQDPNKAMASVFEFLGVDSLFASTLSLEAKNRYRRPRNRLASTVMGSALTRRIAHRAFPRVVRRAGRAMLLKASSKPPLDASLRHRLRLHFAPEIRVLAALTRRDYPWGTEPETVPSRSSSPPST